MKRIIFLFIILFAISGNIFGQLTLDGQFRTRGEYRDGYSELSSDLNHPATLVNQRSRLILNYSESNFDFRFSAQDARVWGENWASMPNNTIHIYEAWGAYRFNEKLRIKLGRQELKYDDQRIMAARNFSITGVAYDAVKLVYNNEEGNLLHIGGMINNLNDTPFLDYYPTFKYMLFVWGESVVSEGLKINALNFFDVSQNPAEPHLMYGRNTLGGNIIYSHDNHFGGRLGLYYQFGNHWMDYANYLGQERVSVSAYSYNSSVWFKPNDNLKLSLNIDTHSGNDWSEQSDKFTAYNRLLSAGHAYLGFMDYFTSADLREVQWAGIQDIFIRADAIITPKFNLQGTIHYLMLQKGYLPRPNPFNPWVEVDKGLGTEIDLVARYKVNSMFKLEAAYMVMLPTETMEQIKLNGNDAKFSHFSYVSVLFTPNFLKRQIGE
ncbi:MAG: alginate export family protein [Bacteroidales bacterium]